MLWLVASVLLTFSLQSPQLPIAVTQDGVQIQCVQAEVGDREIQTPYGVFRNPHDPVVAIIDGEKQVLELRKQHQVGVLDDASWLRDLSRAGQLEELSRASLEVLALDPQAILPFRLLESWGRRIDPVPAKVLVHDRVAWLWQVANGKDFTAAVLAGSKLVNEVSSSSNFDNNLQVQLSDLRKALRSSSVVRRRIASQIAGRQQEFSLRETLLAASIEDDMEAARDAAAIGAHTLHASTARAYWTKNLAQGKEEHRIAAAFNLGAYGGADGLDSLIAVLSAWEHPTGSHYEFGGRHIHVVSTRDRNTLDIPGYSPEQEEVDIELLSSKRSLLDPHAPLKVKRFGEGQLQVLLEALDAWAGKATGRSRSDWIKFYLEDWLPAQS